MVACNCHAPQPERSTESVMEGMSVVLSVLWVLLIFGLLHWSAPDSGYPRQLEQHVYYQVVWFALVGLLIFLQLRLMINAGHTMWAVLLDLGAVSLFVMYRLCRLWISKASSPEKTLSR